MGGNGKHFPASILQDGDQIPRGQSVAIELAGRMLLQNLGHGHGLIATQGDKAKLLFRGNGVLHIPSHLVQVVHADGNFLALATKGLGHLFLKLNQHVEAPIFQVSGFYHQSGNMGPQGSDSGIDLYFAARRFQTIGYRASNAIVNVDGAGKAFSGEQVWPLGSDFNF